MNLGNFFYKLFICVFIFFVILPSEIGPQVKSEMEQQKFSSLEYNQNGNMFIEREEAISAVNDYSNMLIPKRIAIDVVNRYLMEQPFISSTHVTYTHPGEALSTVLLPVCMYYLDRYFSNVYTPYKTETDLAIASILNKYPETKRYFLTALKRFKEIPNSIKYEVFDEDTVLLTSDISDNLDLDYIQYHIQQLEPSMYCREGRLSAPTNLVVNNISQETGIDPIMTYMIQLKWDDNSEDEDGFLIYRKNFGIGADIYLEPQIISTLGPNVTTFVDTLTKPTSIDDQFCYQVVAFRNSKCYLWGQLPEKIKSLPTGNLCSYYDPIKKQQPPDTDHDGFSDEVDECPTLPGNLEVVYGPGSPPYWPNGCPDKDNDGVPDVTEKPHIDTVDMCPNDWGDGDDGCPIGYQLRWMGMIIHNFSWGDIIFYNPLTGKNSLKLEHNEYWNDDRYGSFHQKTFWSGTGEEPYLVFSINNGEKGYTTKRWCCGEYIITPGPYVNFSTQVFEPDDDTFGNEDPNENPQKIRDYGLQIWPHIFHPDYSVISKESGLLINTTLMERDFEYQALIQVEKGSNTEAEYIQAAYEIGSALKDSIGLCGATGPETSGIGCAIAVGYFAYKLVSWLIDLFEDDYEWITVTDPDDYQGTDIVSIGISDAKKNTEANGVWPFCFRMPTINWYGVINNNIYPEMMEITTYFCLIRMGTSENLIKQQCADKTKFEEIKTLNVILGEKIMENLNWFGP